MRCTPLDLAVRRSLRDLGLGCVEQGVVVGLSGGSDSVALLDALASVAEERGFPVIAAHLDHGLRPDSRDDVAFCEGVCRRLGVGFRTARADVRGRAERDGCGIEEAARIERYEFLRSIKRTGNLEVIAVAHTLDDQAETLLLRLLRGAGSVGLGSMRARAGDLVRPLLGVSRRDVAAHLAGRGLPWREDPSNHDLTFERNRIRHELIPYLESRFNPATRAALARAAGLLADEADALRPSADALWEQAAAREGPSVVLDGAPLRSAPLALARLVVRRALNETGGLRAVQSVHVDSIVRLASSATSSGRRLDLPGDREALFRFGRVAIGPRKEPGAPYSFPLPVPGRVDLPTGLSVLAHPDRGPAVSQGWSAVIPEPASPLEVRSRRPGDRVVNGEREESLRRFLQKGRVPADEREGLPLVASGRRVVWVPGSPQRPAPRQRAGERYVRLEVVPRNAAPFRRPNNFAGSEPT